MDKRSVLLFAAFTAACSSAPAKPMTGRGSAGDHTVRILTDIKETVFRRF
jgi:hypothetical protein